ncbi:MAG: tRNA uridine-5-carboxymethylaminomethyl(34) synthesis GTPase MnmE [Christensenellales bacterium]
MDKDTIYAPATPGGGAIAVIRISGSRAHRVLEAVFKSAKKTAHSVLTHGFIVNGSKQIDEVMAVKFDAPRSYTGEDMAEIYCHGGRVGISRIMAALSGQGARLATPGEFTKRAFEAGKMDLSAAGAVMELIGANSAAAADAAMRQLSGALFDKITQMQKLLTDALTVIEAGIEYPEEDIEADVQKDAAPLIEKAHNGCFALAQTFESGRLLKTGVSAAIVGRPNVGKSSLFNMLLGYDRAIVTALPGTTRDSVDDETIYLGIPLKLIDTAGQREARDEVERIGVERAKNAAKGADTKLLVIDRSAGVTERDKHIFKSLDGDVVIALNKCDLPPAITAKQCGEIFNRDVIEVCAIDGQGRDELLARIRPVTGGDENDVTVTSERHRDCLCAAAASLKAARYAFDTADLDCVTIDIKEAWDKLGEITGQTAAEEIINSIFDTFCLGK